MSVWGTFRRRLRVKCTCVAIEDVIKLSNDKGIIFYDVRKNNALEAELTLKKTQYSSFAKLVEQYGGAVEITARTGILWSVFALRCRPVLLVGIALFLLSVFYIPSRIFFVQIENNRDISAETIIDHAQSAGVKFGASRRYVRSETVKNAILSAIPELQWVGVNTRGCVAVISVKERSLPAQQQDSGICSIVSKRDCVIDEIFVKRGDLMCTVGQAVKAGQMLVSGYTDCGISIKATSADAEIYGKTFHELQIITPTYRHSKTLNGKKKEKFSVIFGKKQIKFYKDSGISDTKCVKMYSYSYVTLPGGYVLPIGMLKETILFCDIKENSVSQDDALLVASAIGDRYIKENTVAGEVLNSSMSTCTEDFIYKFSCKYFCREMIGEKLREGIIDGNK